MNEKQKSIVRVFNNGLPVEKEPFKTVSEAIGITEEELLSQLKAWKSDGTIRRFGALVRHHQAGFQANAMGVWNVPDTLVESFAGIATRYREVSHCYQRPRLPDFPYNIYTMIHGRTEEDCEKIAQAISEETRVEDYILLYTIAEFKKSSPCFSWKTRS
ncbi:MAG: Lrp/AsnC family transcriptional regulator [Armatimonadota bacterium]|nr:Lrp/AsnC family transcriptional regulator [Armatimonadota bacterium]